MVASWATSPCLRNQRTSGCRRTIPEAVQGASSNIASNKTPSHQVSGFAASAVTILALRSNRCRFCLIRSHRLSSTSNAITWASHSSSTCPVFPPGAAQASKIRIGVGCSHPLSKISAAICAAASCTDTSPSAKPGMRCTGSAWLRNTVWPLLCVAPIFASCRVCRYWDTVILRWLTRNVMGACRLDAANMSCHCSGYCRCKC